jgi:hypothetical protein
MITVFIVGMIVFFVGAVLDFFYNIIIAPSIRMSLTLRLDELRHEAILLKAEYIDSEPYLDCLTLQESIEFMIRKLRRISLSSWIYVELESRRSPGFLTRAQERARMLDESTVPRVRMLRQRALDIATKALAVNSIAWAPLLVAPSIVAVARSRLRILTSLSVRELHQSAPFRPAVEAYT